MDSSDRLGLRLAVSFVVRDTWAVPESAMALCVVVQVVSTVVRMLDDKYFGLLIISLHFQTYKTYVFTNNVTKHTKILKFSKIFSI